MTDQNDLFDDDIDTIQDQDEDGINDKILTRKELTQSRARLRSWLNRDHEASEKRAKQLASQLLATDNHYALQRRKDNKNNGSFAYGVTNLAGRVLNSLNITPRINVDVTPYGNRPVSGSTDFVNISIGINVQKFDSNNVDSMTELLHMVKGLVYHEGGHILYTMPLPDLCASIGCKGRHALPLDIPLPAGITDTELQNLKAGFDQYFFQAWNILEDQRMETALVAQSPVMSRYLTTLVCKNVVSTDAPEASWPWLVGRTYLPREFRQHLRDLAEGHKRSDLIPEINSVIMRYRQSNNHVEMHECITKMATLLVVWMTDYSTPGPLDNHTTYRGTNSGKSDVVPVPMPPDYDIEEPSGSGISKDGEESESESEPVSQSDSTSESGKPQDQPETNRGDSKMGIDQANEKSNPQKPQNGDRSAGHKEGQKSAKSMAEEIISDNMSQMNVNEVTSFISDINHSLNALAAHDTSRVEMNASESKAVSDVRNGMLNVLDNLIVQVDPTWAFYQDDGVIDPTAYTIRDPGDMNFWSGMNGDQGNGHDLAVSLLVDSSGSMDHEITNVSVIAMGIRRACENYDIPCTITTFSDTVRLVAAGDEPTTDVKVEAGGGTHIFDAMTLLDDQRYGKRYHLVVILTDGEWGDLKDVRAWGTPTRHIMIVGYRIGSELIANKGANSCVTISNMSQLAPLVTNALAGYFSN